MHYFLILTRRIYVEARGLRINVRSDIFMLSNKRLKRMRETRKGLFIESSAMDQTLQEWTREDEIGKEGIDASAGTRKFNFIL